MNDIRENLQEPSLLPPLMDAIANITVENLRAIAVVQLERITAYQSTINVLSDSINVDELMQRYRARKSYFGLAADWFGQQSLWVKALIGAASCCAAASSLSKAATRLLAESLLV